MKNKALALKDFDKEKADNTTEMVVTADTEALLTAPHNDTSLMFFHSKKNLHNFTFYDLHTKDVQNFLWSESMEKSKVSNFTMCYIEYLMRVLEENPSLINITLWSDGCGYQNKCNVLASTLLTFAVEQSVTLTHKYLEVGHTHMECDSVHSNVEKKRKEMKINLPADYINVIESARTRQSKY